ncbi:MAG: VOC family protein [Bryobacteraceae bacterium]
MPEFYRTVSRVTWITPDARRTVETWRRFGLDDIEPHGDVQLNLDHRGRPSVAKVRRLTGWLGALAIDCLQPLGGSNPYTEFLSAHGEGIFALLHEPPTPEAFNAEIGRMRRLGVSELMRAGEFLYFDTVEGGKYALGLVVPDGQPGGEGRAPVTQFAFVARDLAAVSKYWARLGFPEMSVTRPQLRDLTFRGAPASFQQELGWQRHGKIAYEWCPPPRGARTVYQEFLDRHGEGVHHLAFNVDDMDRAIREKGLPVVQAGAWGEAGQKGSGRFAYLETGTGVIVELLWSRR